MSSLDRRPKKWFYDILSRINFKVFYAVGYPLNNYFLNIREIMRWALKSSKYHLYFSLIFLCLKSELFLKWRRFTCSWSNEKHQNTNFFLAPIFNLFLKSRKNFEEEEPRKNFNNREKSLKLFWNLKISGWPYVIFCFQ